MLVFHSDRFELPLPPGHRFPVAKYAMLRERLVHEGIIDASQLVVAPAVSSVDLERVHTEDWRARVVGGRLSDREIRRIGLPWSRELVTRSLRSVGATVAATRAAMDNGHALYLGGGTHHAFADAGAGFCVFNDVPVALRALQAEGRVSRALIVDCDVHQGDGTAAILRGDATIFTFSIHGADNFPARKQESDLDIALPSGTGDEPYLEALQGGLGKALEASRADLAVYLAGADPYEKDRLGRLALTRGGLQARDRMVLDAFRRAGLPVAVVMAGGYARPIEETVDVQIETVRIVSHFAGRASVERVRERSR